MAKRGKSVRMTRKEYLQRARREYAEEFGVIEVDPDECAKWMVATGRYQERPLSIEKRCKQELVRALKDERTIDPQGREVRANHCVRWKEGEEMKSLWAGIFEMKPGHMRVSMGSRMRQIEAQVHQHHTDLSSYNDNNIHGAQLALFDYDFNKAIEEKSQPTEYPDSPPDANDDGGEDGPVLPVG